ncbi:unnamed protein product [Pleuronectes platessa]|uniref:Uncharacterized protein n=1 Tax=Pleuronectes platessa TaxID=8262 RepID=A0A9N7U0N6_PLEPL|nr:unnamed protein product [Pleuronectes platessa]
MELQMGKTGDRTPDLQVGGRLVYRSATAAQAGYVSAVTQSPPSATTTPTRVSRCDSPRDPSTRPQQQRASMNIRAGGVAGRHTTTRRGAELMEEAPVAQE